MRLRCKASGQRLTPNSPRKTGALSEIGTTQAKWVRSAIPHGSEDVIFCFNFRRIFPFFCPASLPPLPKSTSDHTVQSTSTYIPPSHSISELLAMNRSSVHSRFPFVCLTARDVHQIMSVRRGVIEVDAATLGNSGVASFHHKFRRSERSLRTYLIRQEPHQI